MLTDPDGFRRRHPRTASNDLSLSDPQTDFVVFACGARGYDQQHARAPKAISQLWRDLSLREEVAVFSDLPVFIVNDATAACRAEHVYGRGKEFRDYAYFFVAAFIGGGIVLNHSVFEGHQGNAGAFGSLPSTGPIGESRQVIAIASLHVLEARLREAGLDPARLWQTPQAWRAMSIHGSVKRHRNLPRRAFRFAR